MGNDTVSNRVAFGVFVDRNNTVYAVGRGTNQILIWLNGGDSSMQSISGSYGDSYGIFVTDLGNIYVDNGNDLNRVEQRVGNVSNTTWGMDVSRACYGLFVDAHNYLYCSMKELHQVVKVSLDISSINSTNMIAGTGCEGNEANELRRPYGIFVNDSFDLFVADCGNNRIQLFKSGQINGSTVVGSGAPNQTISLNCPTGIIFDADGQMYISDNHNHRIVTSGPMGSRCIIGCTNVPRCVNLPRLLEEPQALSFDSYGNLYVTEWIRHQLKKFFLASNSCCTYRIISRRDCYVSNHGCVGLFRYRYDHKSKYK